MFQPKVLEAIDYIRNINIQRLDIDAIYKHISRSEASNIDKTTVANIIDPLIDRNVIENKKITSAQASCFHHHEERNKTVTASPEKTCDESNLAVTTNNITTNPLDVPEVLHSSNNRNKTIITFNIDLDTPIPFSPRPF